MGTVAVRWVEERFMVGSDSNGHSVAIGKSPETGFEWGGIKPSDLLLLAVSSCTAYDVIDILLKQREPLTGLKVACKGEQQSDPPYTFTQIHLHYMVTGNVNPDKLLRAMKLSEEKYCSVISTLRPGVPITSSYELVPVAAPNVSTEPN